MSTELHYGLSNYISELTNYAMQAQTTLDNVSLFPDLSKIDNLGEWRIEMSTYIVFKGRAPLSKLMKATVDKGWKHITKGGSHVHIYQREIEDKTVTLEVWGEPTTTA